MLKALAILGLLVSQLGVTTGCKAQTSSTDTDQMVASGFESGSISPFVACTYKSPAYAAVLSGGGCGGSYKLKTYFDESAYDGTRVGRGIEFCTTRDITFQKQGWHGFAFYAATNTYPKTKDTIIAQQFCPGGCSSWCATVRLDGVGLAIDHRNYCGTPTTVNIVSQVTWDAWHTVVIKMVVSNSAKGEYTVWYDGQQVYSATNINIGFGDSWSNDVLTPGVSFKNGMYCADTQNYANQTRTLYFDNVSWLKADSFTGNGYDTVAP